MNFGMETIQPMAVALLSSEHEKTPLKKIGLKSCDTVCAWVERLWGLGNILMTAFPKFLFYIIG